MGIEQIKTATIHALDVSTWPEPQPLPDSLPPVMAFDEALLPACLRPWIMDIAEQMQCPPDFPAVAAMVALGSVVGRQIGIHPKKYDDWLVVPNLWGALVGRPSVMKTPAMVEAMRPLTRLEAEARQTYDTKQAKWEAECTVFKALQKAADSKIEKAAKGGAKKIDLLKMMDDTDEPPPPPIERRYSTRDATVETIGELLKSNPHGLLVVRDELRGWLANLDRYGREGDRYFYLEGWNGTGRFQFDRIGRGSIPIPAHCLNILGNITPGKLRDYVYQATTGGSGDDGLMQRFQLLVWPDDPGPWENIDRWPNTEARKIAFELFKKLADLNVANLGANCLDPDDEHAIPALRFDDGGQRLFNEWRTELEERIRAEPIPAIESHLAKYRKLMPALALLLHLAEIANSKQPGPVSAWAAAQASDWCDYLETHARRLYGAIQSPHIEAARVLLDRLKQGRVELDDSGCFLPWRVVVKNWSRLDSTSAINGAIEALEALGWVVVEHEQTGGRPTQRVYVHPNLRSNAR